MSYEVLMSQMFLFFSIMAIGFILYRCKYLNKEFNATLSKFLVNVALPCTILSSVLKKEGRPDTGVVVSVFAIAFVMYAVLSILAYLTSRIYPVKRNQKNVYAFLFTFGNVGFMGFPIMSAIYGNTAVVYAAVFNIVFNLFCFTFGAFVMSTAEGGESKLSLKSLINPGFIIIVCSIVIFFLNISFPAPIKNVIDSLGETTTPLAMLLMGSVLATNNVKEVIFDWFAYIFAILRQFVLPVVCIPLLNLFIHDELVRNVTYIMLLMPCANSAVMFANQYGADEKQASRTIFITTVLAIGTIPLSLLFI